MTTLTITTSAAMSVLRALVVGRSSGRVGVRPVWKATQQGGGRTAPIPKTFVLLDTPSSRQEAG